MKTLVIHPDDRSTDFLKEIYLGKGYDVITRWDISEQALRAMVETHDRIIFLGHGSNRGLIGYSHIFMNPKFIKVLQTKNPICVWCHADKYVTPNNIKGFFTQMFCSEYSECDYEGVENVKRGMVEESNETFASIMSKYIDQDINVIYKKVTHEYGILAENNPVAAFNNERLLLIQ